MGHAFVSYVRQDAAVVDRLAAELRERGLKVWIDRDSIAAGQNWRDEIRKAIHEADLFIACFSRHSAQRTQTFINEELLLAIREVERRSIGSWFIDVSLDGWPIPKRRVAPGEPLQDVQPVDLSQGWREGIQRIVEISNAKQLFESGTPNLELDEAKPATNWFWSSEAVTATLKEVIRLILMLEERARELSARTSVVSIRGTFFPGGWMIRLGNRAVLVYWHQPYSNEVEDARLYILEYDLLCDSLLPTNGSEPSTKKELCVAVSERGHGWSLCGEFISTGAIIDMCVSSLVNREELSR